MENRSLDSKQSGTIALQKKTIQDIQAQLDAKQAQFDNKEALLAGQIDYRKISQKAASSAISSARSAALGISIMVPI